MGKSFRGRLGLVAGAVVIAALSLGTAGVSAANGKGAASIGTAAAHGAVPDTSFVGTYKLFTTSLGSMAREGTLTLNSDGTFSASVFPCDAGSWYVSGGTLAMGDNCTDYPSASVWIVKIIDGTKLGTAAKPGTEFAANVGQIQWYAIPK